jgi:hypothetical protein
MQQFKENNEKLTKQNFISNKENKTFKEKIQLLKNENSNFQQEIQQLKVFRNKKI